MIFLSRLLLTLLLMLSITIGTTAQTPSGVIRGSVINRYTAEPVPGVSVLLLTEAPNPGNIDETDPSQDETNPSQQETDPIMQDTDYVQQGAITDSAGAFEITGVEPGRYYLQFSHVGYHDLLLYDVLVISGKERVVEAALTLKTLQLSEVSINGNSIVSPAWPNAPGRRVITIEQTNRYAATFNDPVRVMASYPGVSTVNDQANHTSVRGNSPASLGWKIEGADVVNPNHLTNAGTLSDKPTLTGGGVAIISSQLLSQSVFLNGALPAGYGNALSGIFDYRLRKGNNKNYEFTAQAGFLGIDLSAEGPFSRNKPASFVANFRYSTIALFELAGIPIDDESISFSDLAFNISLPTAKAGNFTIYAIGGNSTTSFTAQRDSSKWLYAKDMTDYDFTSRMGATGITHTLHTGRNSYLHTSAAISYISGTRDEHLLLRDYTTTFNGSDRLDEGKISVATHYSITSGNNTLKAGMVYNHNSYLLEISEMEAAPAWGLTGNIQQFQQLAGQAAIPAFVGTIRNDAAYSTVQPFVSLSINSGKFSMNPGIHFLYSGFNNNLLAEPRLLLKYSPTFNNTYSVAFSLQSMIQHPSVYFNTVRQNRLLSPTRTIHIVSGYSNRLWPDMILRTELYYQHLYNIPVSTSPGSFSAINIRETDIINLPLTNKGTANNYGIDLSLEKNISKKYYYILAASIYNSTYRGSDQIERSTRFNGKYRVKATGGKEFVFNATKGINTLGINIITIIDGGMRYTPVNRELSARAGTTIYDQSRAFSQKQGDYFRLDTRITWRKDRHGFTETFALDIQNLTNHKNTAWIYYDVLQNTVVTKNQLGLIPVFSYKIEF